MAAKRKSAKVTAAEAQKRLERVVFLARRWAKYMRGATVLSSPSHHLLRAVDKLEALDS